MMRNGFFCHLLPGNEDTEGLKGICVRIAGRESKQALIGLARYRSSVGRKDAFEVHGCIPVRAKLGFGSSECLLCGKRSVELHG